MLDTIRHDLRYSLRSLRRTPGFAAATVLVIALGVGGTTAVFSVVYGVLLRPLPYDEPDRLVTVADWLNFTGLTDATAAAWIEEGQTIDVLGGYRPRQGPGLMTAPGEPRRVLGVDVTPAFFRVFRTRPAAGRLFDDADAQAGAPPVVVLSYPFWQRRFGGDTSVIGRTITLDEQTYEIIGVADRVIEFPGPEPVDLYGVVVVGGSLRGIARLAPGVTPAQAAAEGTAVARRVERPPTAMELFGRDEPLEVRVEPLVGVITARVRPVLLLLAGSIGLVLLIACANVTNLVLSRNTARARELAVRAALGAGRAALIRHSLADTLLLSLAGGALGVGIGWGLTNAVPALAPANFPRLDSIQVDLRVLGVACLASLVVAIVSGILPAMRNSGTSGRTVLRVDAGAGAGHRARTLLLGVEAGLAVMLLVVAILLGRSFTTLLQVDRGYDAEHVLMGTLYFTGVTRDADRRQAALDEILERLRSVPGVTAAGAGSTAPFSRMTTLASITIPDAGGRPVAVRMGAPAVSPGYAEALGMRLREGRFIEDDDIARSIGALMVNEAFARTYLADGRPIVGRQYGGIQGFETTEIVGVVADILPSNLLATGPDPDVSPQVFMAQRAQGFMTLFVRTEGDPAAFAPILRTIVRDVDPAIALEEVGPLASRVADTVSQPRFSASVLGAFALLAVLLAASGLYGVLSYAVTQRRRELGVRAAVGADRAALIGLVMRQGLAVTTVGLIAGLLGSVWITRLLQAQLFGISPLDVTSFVAAPLVLLAVAAAACVLPALRASRVNPVEVLQVE